MTWPAVQALTDTAGELRLRIRQLEDIRSRMSTGQRVAWRGIRASTFQGHLNSQLRNIDVLVGELAGQARQIDGFAGDLQRELDAVHAIEQKVLAWIRHMQSVGLHLVPSWLHWVLRPGALPAPLSPEWHNIARYLRTAGVAV